MLPTLPSTRSTCRHTIRSIAAPLQPLLKACVEHGTDYCDLTGETLWLHHMLAKYGDQAKAKGVLIVPMSGFDSVPADLGTFFLVDYIRRQYGVRTGEVKGMMYGKGGISGGTIASALTMTVQPDRALALNPLFLVPEERGGPPAASIVDNNISDSPMIPRKNSILGKSLWEGYFIMSGVNSRIVRRSAVIFATRGHNLPTDSADTLKPLPILGGASTPAAGIDTSHVYSFAPFKYSESMIFGGWMGAWGLTIGLGIIAILSSIPGLINFVKQYLPQPGSGPSKEDLEKNNWFHYYLVGKTEEAVPRTVIARVRGGDGGYGETCKMLAEAGMSLALERASLPGTSLGGGFLTPSTCFGHRLVKRLQAADLVFEIVSTAGADSGDADTGHLRAGLKDRRPSPGDGAKLLKAGVF